MSWASISVDEVTSVVSKGTTPKVFTAEGVNYIKAEALNGDSSLDEKGFYYISSETHESLRRSQLKDGDVLLTIAGAQIGRCGIVDETHLPANTNQAVGIMRPNPEKVFPRFLYYFFKQSQTFRYVQGLNAQAAQPNINLTMLKRVKLKAPDLDQQKAIANVLSAYDDLIENNRRRMGLLEESARLLYKEWFVHLRFPGHEQVNVVDGVPDGWKSGCISDFFNTASGGTPSRKVPEYYGGDIGWVKTQELLGGFIFDTEEKITETALNKSSAKLFPKHTVLVAMYGATIGQTAILANEATTNQACCAVMPKESFDDYVFVYLFMNENKGELIGLSQGAVQNNISQQIIKAYPMLFPTARLREDFSEAVTPILEQVKNLQLQNQKLAEARDLLLPRLMNGEIEV